MFVFNPAPGELGLCWFEMDNWEELASEPMFVGRWYKVKRAITL